MTTKSSASSRGNVTKKSRPKIGTKSKVIKFHQYFGPKNLQQQLEPCASSPTATADTPFSLLVQQQQMLLRWQLEMQQKNMQFLLSMPSNEPPKPAPPNVAMSTLAPQPTSTNVAVKPSATVAPVSPAQAAKRSRLEDMKVAELREECRRLNIARSGPKPVLIERLLPYAEDILSGSSAAASSENKPVEQFVTSMSAGAAPTLNMSNNDASTASNVMMNMLQLSRMVNGEKSINDATSGRTSVVPMEVDSVACKHEPKTPTPDIAQPNVFPMMFMPTNNNGNVVRASVNSTVPPLIMYRPSAQPMVRPANAAKPFPSMFPTVQEQILMQQQHHISQLEHNLQLSQQELVRAQQQARIQQLLQSNAPLRMNSAAINGSSMSASMSSADSRPQPQLLVRTNRYVW